MDNENENENEKENYFSLKYFLKSIKLIRKIINSKYTHSSLITESELKCFIKNKDNIILFNKIIDNNLGSFDTIFSSIKWEKNDTQNIRSIDSEQLLDMFTTGFPNSNQGMVDLFTFMVNPSASTVTSTGTSTGTSGTSTGTSTNSTNVSSRLLNRFF